MKGLETQYAGPARDEVLESPTSRLERGFAVVLIFVVALLHSVSKLRYGEASDDSVLGEVVWTAMYVFACVRLWMLRKRAATLMGGSAPLGIFLAITLASMLWSISPFTTFKSAFELIGSALVGAYIVARFTLEEFFRILATAYSIISVISLALVFGSPARGRADWGAGPYCGLFSDKNGLGLAMALATVTFALYCLQLRGRRRFATAALLLMCVILLVGSNSMTAVIVLFLVASFISVAWAVRTKRYVTLVSVAFVLSGLAIVIFGVLAVDTGQIFSVFGRNANLTGRTEMWPGLLVAVHDSPLLGYGYNTFFGTGGPELSYIAGFVDQYGWIPPHAHNSFLQIALDTGVVGLISFCVALVITLIKSVAFYFTEGTFLSLWPFATLAFLTLGSYDETYFPTANCLQWVFFIAAALYPLRNAGRKQQRTLTTRQAYERAEAT